MKHSILNLATLLFFLSVLISWLACTPVYQQRFATEADVEMIAEVAERSVAESGCNNPLNYIPDTNHLNHTPVKHIRINIHFINSSSSPRQYDEGDAGRFVRELLTSAEKDLRENNKMWLPHRNDTPVLPTRYEYQLTGMPGEPEDRGIYVHSDDDIKYVHRGKNRNLFDRSVIERYGLQVDSVLNIFILPHHPDSVASPTYSASGVAVAMGNAIKVAGVYANGGPGWNYRGILNHEIGHIYGLSHTWAFNDGCEDTPRHPQNCWNRSKQPPCDTMAGNNVMDYNAMQHAWTPCQIGRVHYAMSRPSSRGRQFLDPRWCKLDEAQTIVISEDISWDSQKDLEGNLIIEEGGTLTVSCRLSLPQGAVISVRPGGTLLLTESARLHNACGGSWQGIEIVSIGEKKGRIIFQGEPQIENASRSLEASRP